MTGADILRAVEATTPLINPRLADIDWDDVAAALADDLAATPAPLDVIAAVRKVFDSGARLKHKADDPTSSYDPLARETVVLAALRAGLGRAQERDRHQDHDHHGEPVHVRPA